MTYESRGARASHTIERDMLLLTCGCGAQYVTRPDEPAEMCQKCKSEVAWCKRKAKLAEQQESKLYNERQWALEYDASAYPMKVGYKLSADEVEAGVRLGTFALGTRLTKQGVVHVVTQSGLEAR